MGDETTTERRFPGDEPSGRRHLEHEGVARETEPEASCDGRRNDASGVRAAYEQTPWKLGADGLRQRR